MSRPLDAHNATGSDSQPAPSQGIHASVNQVDPIDAALAEAQRLRQQAIRDFGATTYADFWRGADAMWQGMVSGSAMAARSARRWQARLQRSRARAQPCVNRTV